MPTPDFAPILSGLSRGEVVPYLGPGILDEVRDLSNGEPIPADSNSLILALNKGRPMAPKLMYEFPRAAMDVELKRGRSAVNRFLSELYGQRQWSRAAVHDWLASIKPGYVVDINRDLQLQESYAGTPHLLIHGISRVGGTEYRFRIYQYDGAAYREVAQDEADPKLPILYKPMGSPQPQPSFIASDADYVDYITELMGGFAIPSFLKGKRRGLRYLMLGMRFTRDTERMVFTEIRYGSAADAGWILIPNPTVKERRFCDKQGLEIIEADYPELLAAAGFAPAQAAALAS